MEAIHIELTYKAGELGEVSVKRPRGPGGLSHIIVLEMGTEDAPAELADVGDDKGGAEVGPGNEMGRLGVVDHPR